MQSTNNMKHDLNAEPAATGAVTRRSFLTGLALGGAGMAGAAMLGGCAPQAKAPESGEAAQLAETGEPSFMTPPEPVAEADIVNTLETDVLVIGGATAGSITASVAATNGLNVIMIEKNDEARCIGRDFGFVNPKPVLDAGLPRLDPYELTRDHIEKSGHRVCGDVVYRFMTKSEEAGNWFTDKCATWGLHPEVQAYSSNSDFYRNYTHVINYYPEEGRSEDRYGVMKTMLSSMAQEVVDAGGQYLTRTEAVELVRSDDGAITGAICSTDEGYVRINASKGVVLATGDYAANEEMMAYYSGWPLEDIDWPESTGMGEGHKLGLWIGAKMQEAPHPMMLFKAYCYHYLRVNKHGRRYVNEDSGYVGTAVSQLRQPDHISFAIWDSKWPTELPASLEYGGGMAWDQDFRAYGEEWTAEREEESAFGWERDEDEILYEADTLEELADLMGFEGDARETLFATIDRYNELVATGNDEDFGKRPELLTSITEPPFYALDMKTELGVSVGGFITDVDSNVLDEDGSPIPGLYAVGTVTGTLFGVDYNETTVPGISLARNVVFGKALGEHLASPA